MGTSPKTNEHLFVLKVRERRVADVQPTACAFRFLRQLSRAEAGGE